MLLDSNDELRGGTAMRKFCKESINFFVTPIFETLLALGTVISILLSINHFLSIWKYTLVKCNF